MSDKHLTLSVISQFLTSKNVDENIQFIWYKIRVPPPVVCMLPYCLLYKHTLLCRAFRAVHGIKTTKCDSFKHCVLQKAL